MINRVTSQLIQVQVEVFTGLLNCVEVKHKRTLELYDISTIAKINTQNITPAISSDYLIKKTIIHDFTKFNTTGLEIIDTSIGVEEIRYLYPVEEGIYNFLAAESIDSQGIVQYYVDFNPQQINLYYQI